MLHNDNKDMFDDVCDCGYEDTNDGIEFSDPSHDKDSHSVIMRLAVLHTPSGEESSDTRLWTLHCHENMRIHIPAYFYNSHASIFKPSKQSVACGISILTPRIIFMF